MLIDKEKYRPRIMDEKIEKYLQIFKAINIVGPKWCGKTWTSLTHGNSLTQLTNENVMYLANIDPSLIFDKNIPQVIDEWQRVPKLWDVVRNECDRRTTKGNFILTGSIKINFDKSDIFHSGTGRIVKFKMYPMTLFEADQSLDEISLMDLYDGNVESKRVDQMNIKTLAKIIINGGWPDTINIGIDTPIVADEYLKNIVNEEHYSSNVPNYNANYMKYILDSLSRNESSFVSVSTILRDINKNGNDISRPTLEKYLNILEDLYIINNQKSYSVNYRSSSRVGVSEKRHLVDPSLACSCLGLSVDKLMNDLNTFGLLFESLVYRDLSVYMEYYGGQVYAFRDNKSGDEVDSIIEFGDGEYGAIEIKLGMNSIDDAIKSLNKFEKYVTKKPRFKAVIVGICNVIYKDQESGVYIIPFNALGLHKK